MLSPIQRRNIDHIFFSQISIIFPGKYFMENISGKEPFRKFPDFITPFPVIYQLIL